MKKKEYIRPEMTVVEFKVEQGFAASGSFLGIEGLGTRSGWGNDADNSFFSNDASTSTESYSNRSGWGSEGGFWD